MLSIAVISLYTTYAYEENNNTFLTNPSISNYNLIYSLKESTNKEIIIGPKEEKFIDINLQNTYLSTIKYGMYYYLISPETFIAYTGEPIIIPSLSLIFSRIGWILSK